MSPVELVTPSLRDGLSQTCKLSMSDVQSRQYAASLDNTPSPPTKSAGFRGFDSSRLLILKGGNSHVRRILTEPPGKFDSRTLSRETLNRWTGRRGQREHQCSFRGHHPKTGGAVFSSLLSLAVIVLCVISPLNYPPYILTYIYIYIQLQINSILCLELTFYLTRIYTILI